MRQTHKLKKKQNKKQTEYVSKNLNEFNVEGEHFCQVLGHMTVCSIGVARFVLELCKL